MFSLSWLSLCESDEELFKAETDLHINQTQETSHLNQSRHSNNQDSLQNDSFNPLPEVPSPRSPHTPPTKTPPGSSHTTPTSPNQSYTLSPSFKTPTQNSNFETSSEASPLLKEMPKRSKSRSLSPPLSQTVNKLLMQQGKN